MAIELKEIIDMTSDSDQRTADAFASSWNNLPTESVYTVEQFADWFDPIVEADVRGLRVLELGCGNGSLLAHMLKWSPSELIGIDLGSSVESAGKILARTGFTNYKLIQHDLTKFQDENKFDLSYSIGVLHHLTNPESGFQSVINNTKSGGRFHCWVYGREGNWVVIHLVDPIRRIACHLPWWLNKYFISTPLAVLFYAYAHTIVATGLKAAPLYLYCKWITKRNFKFFRHVVFDQLVTPVTRYISKEDINNWIQKNPRIEPDSVYLIFRNGNSWKFGGRCR